MLWVNRKYHLFNGCRRNIPMCVQARYSIKFRFEVNETCKSEYEIKNENEVFTAHMLVETLLQKYLAKENLGIMIQIKI